MSQEVTFGPPVISVDIEDWPQSTWNRDLPITTRAAVNTRRILTLLGEAKIRATLFVLGKFAEVFPEVVREMRDAGHEVACHGYGHVEIFNQSRSEFARDIARAKNVLEDILGEPVRGYRAPDFSVIRPTLYALEMLAEAGFEYDSSIFPIRHARYGIPEWPVAPTRVCFSSGLSILEVPIATVRLLDKNWPIGGGGYHRLLPGFLTRSLARQAMLAGPFTLYCHPYELDPTEFKEMPFPIPLATRLHQGLGRRWFAKRLRDFLHQFGGRRMADLLPWPWPNLELKTDQ
jgi:polysaccharide deacetylase family protein (PEP-CTERM system associated)